jgi:hypothetical protein
MPCSIRSANRGLALAVITAALSGPARAGDEAARTLPSPHGGAGTKSSGAPHSDTTRLARSQAGGSSAAAAEQAAKSARSESSPDAKPPRSDALPEGNDAAVGTQPTPPLTESEQRARAEFERAQRAYDLGRFEEAIVHYSRAYEAMALPAFLFNIAQCHRLLGEYAQAAFFYRRYLDLAGNPPNAALARELLSEMEQRQSERERLERETGARVRAALQKPRPEDLQEPIFRRWWFWAAVGGVVAGMTAVTVASTQPRQTTLGTLDNR